MGERAWHDNLIYGLRLEAAEPDAGLWHSRLVLDIDHIVEWICGAEGGASFHVAPATLVFHDVTDLRIDIDFGDSGHEMTLNELSIDEITRETAPKESTFGAQDYSRWCIALNLPQGGSIRFGASCYELALRAEPVLRDQPRLSASERPQLGDGRLEGL